MRTTSTATPAGTTAAAVGTPACVDGVGGRIRTDFYSDFGSSVRDFAEQVAPIGFLAARLTRSLEQWMACFPGKMNESRAVHIGLTHAFQAPWLSFAEHLPACQASACVFGIRDLLDTGTKSAEEAQILLRSYVDIVGGGAATDELGMRLGEIRDRLAGLPLFPIMEPLWRESFDRMVSGILFEREQPSNVEDYLEHAHSVGAEFVNWTLWISADDKSVLTHLDQMSAAIQQATLIDSARERPLWP